MQEDLEKILKQKPSYKYRIEDFTPFVGMRNYAQRNRHINQKSEGYNKYATRKFGLALFNIGMIDIVIPLAYYLSELTR